jgi:hypothetical protein
MRVRHLHSSPAEPRAHLSLIPRDTMPLRSARWIVFVCAAVAFAPAPGAGQEGSARDVAAVLAPLCPGTDLWLTVVAAGQVRGVCRWMSMDSVLVNGTGTVPIGLGAVESVWIRQGRSVGRGALVGGTAGAAILTGLFFVAVSDLCPSHRTCSSDAPRAAILGIGIGGGLGALVGAGVGAVVPGWKRVYAAPRQQPR